MAIKPMEAAGFVSIVAAPAVAFWLPKETADHLVAAQTTVKDFVLLLCVFVLALTALLSRGLGLLTKWMRFSPFYQSAEFTYFYLADGTVITRNRYDLVNGWSKTPDLPSEDLIWHRAIAENDVVYRLYTRGRYNDRRIEGGQPQIQVVPQAVPTRPEDFRYSWRPAIIPALGVKEALSFMVEIVADKTEVAAFTRAGTKLGFGINIPTLNADLTAFAPFGYKFSLLDPAVTVRHSSSLDEVENSNRSAPVPAISPDGTILTMRVRRPIAGRRYWVHYRFEKLARP